MFYRIHNVTEKRERSEAEVAVKRLVQEPTSRTAVTEASEGEEK